MFVQPLMDTMPTTVSQELGRPMIYRHINCGGKIIGLKEYKPLQYWWQCNECKHKWPFDTRELFAEAWPPEEWDKKLEGGR